AEAVLGRAILADGRLTHTQKLSILAGDKEPEDFQPEGFLEAASALAWANYLNVLECGFGEFSGFALRGFPKGRKKISHLSAPESRQTNVAASPDLDGELVARVRSGELDAFEELMNRHHKRVFRTLVGYLGSPEEARDALQDTFLKAFQHLHSFEGRSRFS